MLVLRRRLPLLAALGLGLGLGLGPGQQQQQGEDVQQHLRRWQCAQQPLLGSGWGRAGGSMRFCGMPVAAAAAAASSSSSGSAELVTRMQRRLAVVLKPVRQRIAASGMAVPKVSLMHEEEDGDGAEGTLVLSFSLGASSAAMVPAGLVPALQDVLSAVGGRVSILPSPVSEEKAQPRLALTTERRVASATVTTTTNATGSSSSAGATEVVLFVDDACLKADPALLETFVRGFARLYEAAFAVHGDEGRRRNNTGGWTVVPPRGSRGDEDEESPFQGFPRIPGFGDFGGLFGRSGSGEADGTGDAELQPEQLANEDPMVALEKLGVNVFDKHGNEALDWDSLAGYEDIRREVEDTVVLALQNPDIYNEIATQTRARYESNRPRAVLFEGPPGTGKTLTARIMANRCDVPMVHIPVESVTSKWFGDSEKRLSAVFDACNRLPHGAIIFIDEVDSLATSRESATMHEASRRILSVILQRVEGFVENEKTVVICATNRKDDLDRALLNRFDVVLPFPLPNEHARESIFARYAKQLDPNALTRLAVASHGFSCRDIKDSCEHAERRCAAKCLRAQQEQEAGSAESSSRRGWFGAGKAKTKSKKELRDTVCRPPQLDDYLATVKQRRAGGEAEEAEGGRGQPGGQGGATL